MAVQLSAMVQSEISLIIKPERITVTHHAIMRVRQRSRTNNAPAHLKHIIDFGTLSFVCKNIIRVTYMNRELICKILRKELIVITFVEHYSNNQSKIMSTGFDNGLKD